uniref:Uncharacterized protein n=1 Tax=Arion vulgaris TaxID=1028688 RepID=A0A0B6YK48_9EUPU
MLTQPQFYIRETLGSKDGGFDINHVAHYMPLVKEKCETNTIFLNIPHCITFF